MIDINQVSAKKNEFEHQTSWTNLANFEKKKVKPWS